MKNIALWCLFYLVLLLNIVVGTVVFIAVGFVCTAMFGMNRWIEYYVTVMDYVENRKWLGVEVKFRQVVRKEYW
jgi:hypothetical protein